MSGVATNCLLWVNGPLRLDVFIEDGRLYYIKSHNANIFEMEDGTVDSAEQLDELIQWVKYTSRYQYEKEPCFGDPEQFHPMTSAKCPWCKWKEECEVAVVTGAR